MPFYAGLGEVERIKCSAAPGLEIIKDGEFFSSIVAADSLDDWVPQNCPRRDELDLDKELGCVSCSNAFIDYKHHTIADC